MRIRAFVLLAALVAALAWSAPIRADFTYETTLHFNVTDPAGTTVTGFQLAYNTTTIANLQLLSGSPTTFGDNGTTTVDATFPATSTDDFTWTFTTPNNFPVRMLNFDFTGESAPITGGLVSIDVRPIPEPRGAVLLTIGGVLAWWQRRWWRGRRLA